MPTKRRQTLRLAATLGLLWAALPLAAQETTLASAPNAASWNDQVVVTARGEACAPLGLSLQSSSPSEVVLQLDTFCGLADPPFVAPYEFSLALPRLDPGQRDLVLLDEGGMELARQELWVHSLSDLVIEALPQGGGEYDIRLAGYACGDTWELEGELHDVVFAIQGICDFGGVPMSPTWFEVLIEEAFLQPGLYRFSVTAQISFNRRIAATTEFEVPAPPPPPPPTCGGETVLCLGPEGRHLATLDLNEQAARAVPFRTPFGIEPTVGFFSLFGPGNLEVTVKLLDGCAINGHLWLFASWTTTLGGELRIYDPVLDRERVYSKPGGQTSPAIADIEAFACSGGG